MLKHRFLFDEIYLYSFNFPILRKNSLEEKFKSFTVGAETKNGICRNSGRVFHSQLKKYSIDAIVRINWQKFFINSNLNIL